MRRRFSPAAIALVLCASILCFWNLSNAHIERWDELTNISVVQEMQESGSLTPVLDGKPFLEKPPLWYQMTSALSSVAGDNLFWYRSISAVSGLLIVLVLSITVAIRYGYSSGIVAGFSILSVPHLFVPSAGGLFASHTFRSADLDALQLLFLVCGFALLTGGYTSRRIFSASVLAGLAYLVKGPLAFVLPAYMLVNLKKGNNGWKKYLLSALPAVLIASAWFIPAVLQLESAFIPEFLLYHQFARAVTTLEHHTEQPLFYWLVFLHPLVNPTGVVSVFVSAKEFLANQKFSLTALGIVLWLLVLTVVQTKLSWYIFPVYILAAVYLAATYNKASLNLRRLIQVLIGLGVGYNLLYVFTL